MTQTSLDAWSRIQDTRKLSHLRKIVAKLIAENPYATANEIVHRSGGMQQNSINPRFKELENMGVIKRGYSKKCNITGYEADTYFINPDVTEESISKPGRNFKPAPTIRRIKGLEEFNHAVKNKEQMWVNIFGELRKLEPNLESHRWEGLNMYSIYRINLGA